MLTIDDIDARLRSTGYCPTAEIDCAVLIALAENRPLLIEGAPGVGKTSIAKATADAFGLPLLRIQMYDGLTDDKILYDYDYQKQLLTLEAVKPSLEKEYGNMSASEAVKKASGLLDFYYKAQNAPSESAASGGDECACQLETVVLTDNDLP